MRPNPYVNVSKNEKPALVKMKHMPIKKGEPQISEIKAG